MAFTNLVDSRWPDISVVPT